MLNGGLNMTVDVTFGCLSTKIMNYGQLCQPNRPSVMIFVLEKGRPFRKVLSTALFSVSSRHASVTRGSGGNNIIT